MNAVRNLLITILFVSSTVVTFAKKKTNILFILIDDMGYADLGCYGNKNVQTPHIDQLAREGVRFTQYYVNSPICSPSRVAAMTGQYPSRWGITSYIDNRETNEKRGMRNSLSLDAPFVARNIQRAGYYTAHIGKWHMGGGRDISDAPLITEYGFDESVTQFEGLGERYLARFETFNFKDGIRPLERQSSQLGKGDIHWDNRDKFTGIYVDLVMDAIEKAGKENKPFYINLWPDDIHTPLEPPKDLRGDLSMQSRFLGVMHEMDRQIGRLLDYIRSNKELRENTLIVFTSDNGPDKEVNTAGALRGYKTNLYEGGIREPFIVWWPGQIAKKVEGTTNTQTVMAAIDLPLTFMKVAGAMPDNAAYDGQCMIDAISGKKQVVRQKTLMWIRPPDRPGFDHQNDPDLAIRKGDYKLLMDFDGSNVQLYNLSNDIGESQNLKDTETAKVTELKSELETWFKNYPNDINLNKFEIN